RPDLVLAREDLKVQQMNLISQKDTVKPDLRFLSSYDINSIGTRMDGPDANNALRQLASNHFNNWSVGLRLTYNLGYRAQFANLRIARLELARAYAVLRDGELKTEQFLGRQYRLIFEDYEQIRIQRAQREALAEQLRARLQEVLAGRKTVDILL